jgi:hypothetical protein
MEGLMTGDHFRLAALLALVLAATQPTGAGAQPRPDPTQKPEPAPQSAPGNPQAAPPERIAPPAATPEDSGGSGAPLSDRLSRSQGTIKPPANVDPGMAAVPPDPGPRSMPVIPPPGTPGGNSTVTPK